MSNNFVPNIRVVPFINYVEILVHTDRPQMKIEHRHFACRITKTIL